MIVEVKGDLLNAPQKYIAHGVNCQGVMGSGVAKVLYTKWPRIKQDYLHFSKLHTSSDLLGNVRYVNVDQNKTIINCYTQEYYGRDGELYLSYDALRKCFERLSNHNLGEIAIPKIGCGLAGGDWEQVKAIINEVTGDKLKVVVYLQ